MVEGIRGQSPKQIQKMNKKLDKTEIKFGKSGSDQKLSIFSNTYITKDVKGFLEKFDVNHDGELNQEETLKMKQAIAEAAGKDNILSDEEFAQMMGVKVDSDEFKNYKKQFNILIERQSKGETQTVEKQGDKKITSNFKADGSGTEIIQSKNAQTVIKYGVGHVKLEAETKISDGTIIKSTYINNEAGKLTVVKTTVTDKSGKMVRYEEQKNQYNSDGKKISSEFKAIDANGKTVESSKTSFEYNSEGKLVKSNTSKENIAKNISSEIEQKYDLSTGKLVSQQSKTINKKEGVTSTSSSNFEYSKEGKLQKQSTKGTDKNGKPYEMVDTFAPDGKTKTGRVHTSYKGNSLQTKIYDGNNLENRIKGGVPTEKIIYESDGKTVKERIVNKFDEKGVVIAQETYDKDGKLKDTKDFSKIDGHYDISYQHNRGDCYLLASINSLAQTEEGQKLLQQNVKEIKDESGNVVAYEVSFPGAEQTRKDILDGKYDKELGGKIPADKVHIKGTYRITKEELDAAAQKAGVSYSVGDKDVLLTEVAYEKYRDDVVATYKDNGRNPADPKQRLNIPGMGVAPEAVANGDNLSGGQTYEATYVLTGKQGKNYKRNSKEVPTCYVSEPDLQMSIPADQKNKLSEEKVNDPKLSQNIKPVIDDCKDGKLDNYSVTVSFNVSQQEVNGKIVQNGGHAFSVKSMTDDQVVLANPWDPEEDIVMSMEDFKRSVKSVEVIPITEAGKTSQAQSSQETGEVQNDGETGNTGKSNYRVPKGKGYTQMIKEALISQGVPATKENIEKAKAQFEEVNPDAVHVYKGKRKEWRGNKYLIAGANVYIPNFKMS